MKHILIVASLLILSACRGDVPAADTLKTYVNDAHTFQISYPLGWTLNENASVAENGVRGVTIKEWDRWGVAILDITGNDGQYLRDSGYKLDPPQSIVIDDSPVKVYVLSNRDDMEMGYPVAVVTTKDASRFILWGFYRKSEDKDAFLPVFKEVVSTFKHLQGAASSDSTK